MCDLQLSMCLDVQNCNGGECKEGFGYSHASCFCPGVKFYGSTCQIKTPKGLESSLATGITVFQSVPLTKNSENTVYSMTVYITVEVVGKQSEIIIETSEGYLINVANSTKTCDTYKGTKIYPYKTKCRNCYIKMVTCKHIYVAEILFPYKPLSERGVLTLSGNAIGYMANFNVKYYNKAIMTFINDYPVFVNYDNYDVYDIDLVPIVTMKNCGKRNATAPTYFQRSSLSLEVDNVTKTSGVEPTILWKLWSVSPSRERFIDPDLYNYDNKLSWFIPAFTLKPQMYKYHVLAINILPKKKFSNFVECYFRVISQPLVARIDGGQKRVVFKKNNLLLSGEKSYDPNKKTRHQDDMSFSWKCEPQCQIDQSTDKTIMILSKNLKSRTAYNFTLTVSVPGLNPATTYQEVTVIDGGFSLSIYCVENCFQKSIPTDPLLLEAITETGDVHYNFTWTYSFEYGPEKSVDEIQQKIYPSNLLYIKPNSLEEGEKYQFQVKVESSNFNESSSTSIEIIMDKKPTGGSCSVTPPSGTVGKTLFNITCSGFVHDDSVLVFEYFDKYKSDPVTVFSGRMIASNSDGVLTDIKLSRGIVFIYIFDIFGFSTVSRHEVELSPYEGDLKDVEEMLTNIKTFNTLGMWRSAFQQLSIIPDLINKETDKTYLGKKLLNLACAGPLRNQPEMKLCLASLKIIISTLTKDGNFKLQTDDLQCTMVTIKKLTNIFKTKVTTNSVPTITREMLELLATSLLDIFESVLMNRNETIFSVNEEDMSQSDRNNLLETSYRTKEALDNIAYSLSSRQGKGLPAISMNSFSKHLSITTETETPRVLADRMAKTDSLPLKLSNDLILELTAFKVLTIQCTVIQSNPFFTVMKNLSTVLVNLDFFRKRIFPYKKLRRVNRLKHPVDLFLKIKSYNKGSFSGIIEQSGPTNDTERLDRRVTVFRIELTPRSKLFLSFSFNKSSDGLKIYSNEDLRPDHLLMMMYYRNVTPSNPVYDIPYNPSNSRKFIYIGILPGPNVSVGETVIYDIHFHTVRCLNLNKHLVNSQFFSASQFCSVGDKTDNEAVHCRCTHLSVFSAVFELPPNKIDPFNDVKLFLTVTDNPLVAALVLFLIVVFLLLCIWARRRDKKDIIKKNILVLEDNIPGFTNFYILVAYTGWRLFASTSANVGIILMGSQVFSHAHILRSSKRRVLKYSSDDWFLLRTPQHLGVIEKLHLWHDNSGPSPDWLCEKIVVFDLKNKISYTFLVESWLAASSNEYCEAFVFPATVKELHSVKSIFYENLKNSLQNQHISLSILFRHNRQRLSTLDRVGILMTFIMISLLMSIAFYRLSDEAPGVDEPSYSVGTKEIIISIQTSIMSTGITGFLLALFNRSFTKNKKSEEKTLITSYVRPSESLDGSDLRLTFIQTRDTRRRSVMTFYENFVRMVRRAFEPPPLLPVTLSQNPSDISKRRNVYILTWAFIVFFITSSSYLLVLYGLKLGSQESKKWLTCSTLSLLEKIIILSPFRILFLSILFATYYQRIVETLNFDIKLEDARDETLREQENYTPKKFLLLMNRRQNHMYRPLNLSELKTLRQRRLKQEIYFRLADVAIMVALILILCLVTSNSWGHCHLQTNLHTTDMILHGHFPGHLSFYEVSNRSQFLGYLKSTLTSSLYKAKWYNFKVSLSPPSAQVGTVFWAEDSTMKLLGPPVLQQLRTAPGSCSWSKMFNGFPEPCIPPWSDKVEDTDDYGSGWTLADWRDVKEESSPWRYSDPSAFSFSGRQGETRTDYHGGGYILTLSKMKSKTELKLENLMENEWIDENTRVTFLVFTLYNVNENLYTEVVLIAEHLSCGLYLTRITTNSINFEANDLFWNTIFIFSLVFFLVRSILKLNRTGAYLFFSTFGNICQLFIILLGVLSVLFHFINLIKSKKYVEKFQRQGLDGFFSFDDIIYYSKLSSISTKILFFCLVLRVFNLWQYGTMYLNVHCTLAKSFELLTWLLAILFVVIFAFSRFSVSFFDSMILFVNLYWSSSKKTNEYQMWMPDNIFIFTICSSLKLLFGMIIIHFVYHYKYEKLRKKPSQLELYEERNIQNMTVVQEKRRI